MILILEFQQTVWMFDCVSSSGWPAMAEGRVGECCAGAEGRRWRGGGRGWWRRRRVVETEGGGGGGWPRQRAAKGGRGGWHLSMTLYPHCIPTVSSLYPSKERRKAVDGGGGGGRPRVVGDGGGKMVLYPHCILTVSPLYHHCILTVSLQREVSAEAMKGEEEEGK